MKKRLVDNEIAYLEIEESKINREKSQNVLNKGFTIYFFFLVLGIVGFVTDYLTSNLLNMFVITGLIILIISTLPYLAAISKEENLIKSLLKELKK
jgi:hypothetical protein